MLIPAIQVYVGLVSYGIGHSKTAIASWRLLFIVLGGISLVFSTLILLLFPDRPETGHFLNEKEAFIAVDRKREDQTGIEHRVSLFPIHFLLLEQELI